MSEVPSGMMVAGTRRPTTITCEYFRSGNVARNNEGTMPVENGQFEEPSTSPVPMMLREVRFVNAYIEYGIAVKAAREAGIQGGSDDAIRKLAYQSPVHGSDGGREDARGVAGRWAN